MQISIVYFRSWLKRFKENKFSILEQKKILLKRRQSPKNRTIIKNLQKTFTRKESVTASNKVLLQYRGRKKEICEDQNLSLTSWFSSAIWSFSSLIYWLESDLLSCPWSFPSSFCFVTTKHKKNFHSMYSNIWKYRTA